MENIINKISCIIVQVILKNGYQIKYSQESLTYGIAHMLKSGLAIILALFIGILSGYSRGVLYYLVVFVIIRGLSGGYHAKNPVKCLSLFLGGVIIPIAVVMTNSVWFWKCISCVHFIGYVIIIFFSPMGTIENPVPKEYMKKRKQVIMTMCIISLLINEHVASNDIILSLFGACAILWCSILLMIVKLTRKKGKK